jgi:mevalonate kinase
MPAIVSKVPGKIILFGEHAVVYGYPAIAVPIKAVHLKVSILPNIHGNDSLISSQTSIRYDEIPISAIDENDPIRNSIDNLFSYINQKSPKFKMNISSTIPIAAGLGSSAALSVAITRGMSQFLGIQLTDEEINSLAFKSEKVQHGSPSGIDNSVITFLKPIIFSRKKGISAITIRKPFHIILADTGKRTLTKKVVAFVGERFKTKPDMIKPIFEEIGEITVLALEALKNGNIGKIGELMICNHRALVNLGVSSIELDRLVRTAQRNGAMGAKLCGGGKGGYIVAICNQKSCKNVISGLREEGATKIIPTTISEAY